MNVNYLFEKNQIVRVEVYDDDADQNIGGDDDLIGEYSCPINKILTSHKQTVKGDLRLVAGRDGGSGSNGRVIIVADSVANSNNRAKMTVRCSLWPKKT